MAKDLVCNMEVDEKTAKLMTTFQGKNITSVRYDGKNHLMQTPKNTLAATHLDMQNMDAVAAVTAKPLTLRFNFLFPFFINLVFRMHPIIHVQRISLH